LFSAFILFYLRICTFERTCHSNNCVQFDLHKKNRSNYHILFISLSESFRLLSFLSNIGHQLRCEMVGWAYSLVELCTLSFSFFLSFSLTLFRSLTTTTSFSYVQWERTQLVINAKLCFVPRKICHFDK
jgi:hypothetical protein